MQRVALVFAAVFLPAAAVVTGRAEQYGKVNVANFGPGACVSGWVNKAKHLVVQTACKDQPTFSAYALRVVCVDKDGGRVLHNFEKGGFDPEEIFDTLIVCDKCEAGDLDEVPQVFLTKPTQGDKQAEEDVKRMSEGSNVDDSDWKSLGTRAKKEDDGAWRSLGDMGKDAKLSTVSDGIERDTSFDPVRDPGAPAAVPGLSPSPAPAVQPGLQLADKRLTDLESEVAQLAESTVAISRAMSSLRDKVMRKVTILKSGSPTAQAPSPAPMMLQSPAAAEIPLEPVAAIQAARTALLSSQVARPTQSFAGVTGALSPVAVASGRIISASVMEAEKEAENAANAALEAEQMEISQISSPAPSAAALKTSQAVFAAPAKSEETASSTAAPVQPLQTPQEQPKAAPTQPPTAAVEQGSERAVLKAASVYAASLPAPVAPAVQETEAEKQEDDDLAGLLVDGE